MRKWATLWVALLLLGGGMLFAHASEPKGDTIASREAILRSEPKNIPWEIAVEQEWEGHLLCGITAGQRVGIAVFAPDGDGYELRSRRWMDRPDAIVIHHAMIGETWYDLIWFNGAPTECAELTYTEPGQSPETRRFDTADGAVIGSTTPAGDYALEVRYFDAQGNEYE